MQTANAHYVTVSPTQMIVARGETDAGRDIEVYIYGDQIEQLRQAFRIEPIAGHLGHAFWHVQSCVSAPCSSCGKAV